MTIPSELRGGARALCLCVLELAMAMQERHKFVTVGVEEPQRT